MIFEEEVKPIIAELEGKNKNYILAGDMNSVRVNRLDRYNNGNNEHTKENESFNEIVDHY